jgi:hypothetical protein
VSATEVRPKMLLEKIAENFAGKKSKWIAYPRGAGRANKFSY